MNNPMRAYQRVRITTASPADLVVMLYDGLARFLGLAADAMDEDRWADAGRGFERGLEIIGHLRESLNEEVSPIVVASLDRTYLLWTRAILKAQVEKDVEATRVVVKQVLELSDTWRTVVSQLPAQHPSRVGGP